MEVIGGFLCLLSLFVYLWAVVGLFEPSRARIPHRIVSVAVWVLSVVLAVAGVRLADSTNGSTDGSVGAAPARIEAEDPLSFQARISRALGPSNRSVQGVSAAQLQGERLFVQWAIDDNFTSDMIRRGARLDIRKMLEVIAEGQEPYTSVFLRGTFPLTDRFGNASEANVVEATFTKSAIDRINFENFLTDNVYAIAEDTDIHPEFRDSATRAPAVAEMPALQQAEMAFEGNPSATEIKRQLDRALTLYGRVPLTNENYSRAGSTLGVLRREYEVPEMAILDYMIRSHVPGMELTFPQAAAFAVAFLRAGDR